MLTTRIPMLTSDNNGNLHQAPRNSYSTTIEFQPMLLEDDFPCVQVVLHKKRYDGCLADTYLTNETTYVIAKS